MLLSFIAFVSASKVATEVLLVDGAVLAAWTPTGWQTYRAVHPLPAMSMREVVIGTSGPAVINARFKELEGGLIGVAEPPMVPGVFYSSKAWFPRPVEEINGDRSLYLDRVVQAARERRLKNPKAYIVNVWSVDLDHSGRQAQIVEAVSRPQALNGDTQPGDWNATFLRWHDKNRERFLALNWSYARPPQPMDKCRVRAVADFDGDGLMEVVSTSVGALRWSATLWSLQKGKLTPVVDINADRLP